MENPLSAWKAANNLEETEGTKAEWLMLAEIWKLEAKLSLLEKENKNESK